MKTIKEKKLSYEDISKLSTTFKKLKNDKCKLGLTLIDEALFCGKILKELKEKVNDDGVITIMAQGDYEIERENPALKSYNTTIKNYQALIKQINDLLGDQPKTNEPDELEKFNRR